MLKAHVGELQIYLDRHNLDLVLIQETWLDCSTESVYIVGYKEISRRDRSNKDNRGGGSLPMQGMMSRMWCICLILVLLRVRGILFILI